MGTWKSVDESMRNFGCTGGGSPMGNGDRCPAGRLFAQGEMAWTHSGRVTWCACTACALRYFGERPPVDTVALQGFPAAPLEPKFVAHITFGGGKFAPASNGAPRPSVHATSVEEALGLIAKDRSHAERLARALFETDPRVIAIATKVSECEAYRAAGKAEMAADRYQDAMIIAWGCDLKGHETPPREPALRKEAETRAAAVMAIMKEGGR